MKNKKLVPTLLLTALIGTPVFAQHEVGNGGEAIVCRDNGVVRSAEMLDLYEARTTRGIKPDQSLAHLDRNAIFQIVSQKILVLDPVRGPETIAFARTTLDEISALERNPDATTTQVKFIEDNVGKVNDSFKIFIPKNCVIEQFILQTPTRFPEDRLLNFQVDIWKKMNNPLNQIAAIFHEAFLNRAIRLDRATNSDGTRYINSLLVSNKSLDRRQYIQLSHLASIFVPPTPAEIARPSLYVWQNAPVDAAYALIKKYSGELDPIGTCFVGLELYGEIAGVKYFNIRLGKMKTVYDRRGRGQENFEELSYDTVFEKWGWPKTQKVLESGACDLPN